MGEQVESRAARSRKFDRSRRAETAAVHYLHADARAQVVRESSNRQKLREREREREATATVAAIRSDPIKDG